MCVCRGEHSDCCQIYVLILFLRGDAVLRERFLGVWLVVSICLLNTARIGPAHREGADSFVGSLLQPSQHTNSYLLASHRSRSSLLKASLCLCRRGRRELCGCARQF